MSGIARAVAGDRWAATWLRTVAAMALAVSALTPATASEVQVKSPPAWVNAVSLPLDVKATPGSSSGGVEYLLADRQTRLEAHDRIAYSHYALRAVSGEGVEQAAHVQISFDPTYETLALHTIKVYRGKQILSRLDMAQVKLLQREKDLEARIYDGRKTADVTLQDVRVGDVVEYDYTIRGVNPALGDRRAGSYDLQWRMPMLSMYARLLVPEDRSLRIVPRNTTLRPESQHRDGWVDYVWRAQDVPALAQDDDEPGWYDPYPIVQWTEFPDWAAVAAWALPLYRADADQGAELRAQLEAIARANADPGERLVATLRFVQREVRYLGIEVGAGSLAPRPPRQVLAHRFGDCKDKVLLTVWMLRALGIEAQPALVNTHLTRGLDQYVPAASLFDHVIVHARVAGREYWLDPTRAEQKGTLANLSQASFGRALVVDATTTGLATMPEPTASVPRHDVHTVLDASAGRGKPVGMQITTIYEGESADAMRSTLADQSRDELQRGYLNFYATYYPDVAVQKPFTVTDDGTANRLTVSEFYVLRDQWKRDDDKKRWTFSISSPEMDAQLRTPQRKLRTGPLALRYPLAVTSVTEIRLHKDWALDLKPASVEDPAFKYSFDSSVSGPVVKTTERLDILADNVRADAIAAYVEHARKVHDSLGLSLYMPDVVAPRTAGGDMNWPIALLAVFIAAAAAWLMRRLWHWDPAPRPAPAGVESGLRGWLILPTIAVVVAPLRLVKDLFETLPSYNASTWAALTVSGGARYDALWAPYLLGELTVNILLLATSLLLLRLFFTRRSSLPKIFIGYLLLGLAVRTLDLILASTLLGSAVSLAGLEATALVREGVSAVLWTWYFLASRRVGATFVERLHPALPAAADAVGPSARAPIAEPGDMGEAVPSQG